MTNTKECRANIFFGNSGQSSNTTCSYFQDGICLLSQRKQEMSLTTNQKKKFMVRVDYGHCVLLSQKGITQRLS